MSLWGLFVLAGVFMAMTFQPLVSAPPNARRSAMKTAPLVLFAIGAVIGDAPALLVLGLVLSALGDFALSRDGDRAFVVGVGFFALAHLAYAAVMRTMPGGMPLMQPEGVASWIGLGVILLVAVSTPVWLIPRTGKLAVPVMGYVVIIAVMGVFAMHLPSGAWLAALGAMLFVASDLLLALGKFVLVPEGRVARLAAQAVWPAYWVGQLLILFGIAWSNI